MSDSNQLLERFHRALLEEIQTQRPEYLTGPFTVAEIYQNLVPYGSHRDEHPGSERRAGRSPRVDYTAGAATQSVSAPGGASELVPCDNVVHPSPP